MKNVYIIRALQSGVNLGFVTTRDEAERICAELPDVFTWEPLLNLESTCE